MAGNLASFAIDIAARMSGLESTNAELDALTAKLMGAGKGAEHFQLAARELSSQLDAAKAATASSSSALSLGSEEFRLAEKEAVQAAKGFDKLSAELIKLDSALSAARTAGDASKIAALESAYDELAQSVQLADVQVERANSSLREKASALELLDKQARDASESERKLVSTMGNLRKMSAHVDRTLGDQAGTVSKLRGATGDLGGPIGALSGKLMAPVQGFADLSEALGRSNAIMVASVAGVAAVTVAVAALTAALLVGVAGVAKWAIGLSDANRSAQLSTSAFRAMNPELARLESSFTVLEQATGLSTESLRGIAAQVDAAGVAAQDLPDVLLAAAQAEAALGQGGAGRFLDAMKKSNAGAAAFAKEAQAKLGGIVQKQLLSLDKQSTQLKKNVGSLFGSLNVDPALSGLQTIVGLFDRTSASGSALEFMFGTIFQPLIDKAESAGFVIEAFVLGFEIGMMKLYLAARPVINAVTELFGFDDLTLEDVCKAVTQAAQIMAVVFTAVAVAFGTVATVIGVVIAAYVAFQGALLATAVAIQGVALAAVYALGAGILWLVDGVKSMIGAVTQNIGSLPTIIANAISSALAAISDVSRWVTVGGQIVAGLAQGISGAAGAVIRAITGVASGAIVTAKKLLGIASPSKVFRGLGGYTGEGFALGVEGETGTAQRAMADLVSPPEAPVIAPPLFAPSAGSPLASTSGAVAEAQLPSAPLVAAPVALRTPMQSIDALSTTREDEGNDRTEPREIPPVGTRARTAVPNAGKSITVNLAGATFTFTGVKDAPESLERFAEMLTHVLEGDALAVGAA